MALTDDEQKLLDFALAALPAWFREELREFEFSGASAKLMQDAKDSIEEWFEQTLITTAVGASGSDPDWLNQHAVDRGSTRADGESDAALRSRIRDIPESITRTSLLDAVDNILTAEGVTGTVGMVELPRDKAYFGSSTSDTGTGGTFTDESDATYPNRVGFEPTPPAGGGFAWVAPPYKTVPPDVDHKLAFSGGGTGYDGNTYAIVGLEDDKALFDATVGTFPAYTGTWTVQKFDTDGNILDGFNHSYMFSFDGDDEPAQRMNASFGPTIVIILQLDTGTTVDQETSVKASVDEMLRQKKGAGVRRIVESRIV